MGAWGAYVGSVYIELPFAPVMLSRRFRRCLGDSVMVYECAEFVVGTRYSVYIDRGEEGNK